MRKPLAALAAAALGLTLAPQAIASASTHAPSTRAAAATPRASVEGDDYTPPPVVFGECTNPRLVAAGAQCGNVVVPLDYANPSGEKIKIAISRIQHKTERYQGLMLVNPGGPGGSGLSLSRLSLYVPNHAGDSYDWIGFDPRGVGSSTPSLTCDDNYFHGDRTPYAPTPATHDTLVSTYKGYARDCKDAPDSKLFNHVKTTDNVADMESIRKALGESKINYYGFSYGTYLGQVYATQHPDRMGRFVWDGTVDPRGVWYEDNQGQDRAFQTTFDKYFEWLAKYHDVYHVGDTYAQVRDLYLATVDKLNANAEGGVLGGDEFTDIFTGAGYYVYGWTDIADAYSKYINDGDASGLIQQYLDANAPGTPGADNGYALYLGTQCTDARWPQSQQALDHDNAILNVNYNYQTWPNAWFNGPCAYWKYKNAQPVSITGAQVTTPILMIGETLDAATPFAGSIEVRHLFPTASLIEGKNGTTHAGSLSGVACTDNLIARYLSSGSVPTRKAGDRSDKFCRPVPAPVPTMETATAQGLAKQKSASTSSDRLPADLRKALTEATR